MPIADTSRPSISVSWQLVVDTDSDSLHTSEAVKETKRASQDWGDWQTTERNQS